VFKNCPEFSISLAESVAHLPRHSMYLFSLPSGIMPRVCTAFHLPVAYNDITRQLANCNCNYYFFACPYSVFQEFAVDSEAIVTSHSEIARKLHAWCIGPNRVLKSTSITDKLDISWDSSIVQFSAGMSRFCLLPVPCSSFHRLLLIHHGSSFNLHHLILF